MAIDPSLERLLKRTFAAASSWSSLRKSNPKRYKQLEFDFVFHMTDWMSDIEQLAELYKHPEKADPEEFCTFIIGFLYHVIPHLDAAGQLLLDEVKSPFEPPHQKKTAKAIRQ